MAGLEHLQADKPVLGFDANRIIDALNGFRSGIVTINSTGNSVVLDGAGLRGYNPSSVQTFNLDSATGNVTILGSLTSGSTITGTAITGGSIAIGSGNNIFKADSNGIYLGNATFASAPFRVDMTGAAVAKSFQLLDGSNNIIADNVGLVQMITVASGTSPGGSYTGSFPVQIDAATAISVTSSRPIGYFVIGQITGKETSGVNSVSGYIALDGVELDAINLCRFPASGPNVTQPVFYSGILTGSHTFSLYLNSGSAAADLLVGSASIYVIQFGK